MKASELVRKLNAMIAQYGDKPVAEWDAMCERWYNHDRIIHVTLTEEDYEMAVDPELDGETWFELR